MSLEQVRFGMPEVILNDIAVFDPQTSPGSTLTLRLAALS